MECMRMMAQVVQVSRVSATEWKREQQSVVNKQFNILIQLKSFLSVVFFNIVYWGRKDPQLML